VRNYQARNFLRDDLSVGDGLLFYHSGGDSAAIVGTAIVVRAGYPDFTARDPKSQYYDPKASDENPIWYMVDVRLDEIFAQPLQLKQLRTAPELKAMELLRQGSRLSVQPVRPAEFKTVLQLAGGTKNTSPRRPRA
jgi:predicted RNA-binding protein with PUA-like domain